MHATPADVSVERTNLVCVARTAGPYRSPCHSTKPKRYTHASIDIVFQVVSHYVISVQAGLWIYSVDGGGEEEGRREGAIRARKD